jgi:glycosyltransferase involved in cell wall biosynthesis
VLEDEVRKLAEYVGLLGQQLERVGRSEPQPPFRVRVKARIRQGLGIRIGTLWHHPPRPVRIPAHYFDPPRLTDPPAIAVATPAFNHGAYLERTIRSVLDQDFAPLEYAVQDGGSMDGTLAILERYRPRLKHAESRGDEGQAQAINLAFAHTTAPIMAYLNSDDLLLPGALHYVAHYFATHPEVDAVYGHRILIDEDDGEIGRWVLPPHDDAVLRWADYVPQETLFWRRSLWERVGGALDESFHFAMDWDLLLRFQDAGARIVRVPRFLGSFRVHVRSKTLTQLTGQGADEMNRLRERCHGRTVTRNEIRQRTLGYVLRQGLCHRLYGLGLLRT